MHIPLLERTVRRARRIALRAFACGLVGAGLGLLANRMPPLQIAGAAIIVASIVVGGAAVVVGFVSTLVLVAGLIRREP